MEFKHLCNVCLAKQFVLKKRVLPVFWPLAYSLNYISELFIIMFHKYNKLHLINHFQETVLINLLYSPNNASHTILCSYLDVIISRALFFRCWYNSLLSIISNIEFDNAKYLFVLSQSFFGKRMIGHYWLLPKQ